MCIFLRNYVFFTVTRIHPVSPCGTRTTEYWRTCWSTANQSAPRNCSTRFYLLKLTNWITRNNLNVYGWLFNLNLYVKIPMESWADTFLRLFDWFLRWIGHRPTNLKRIVFRRYSNFCPPSTPCTTTKNFYNIFFF